MQIKSFAKSQAHLELPYLLEVQRASWQRFWDRDIRELLAEISPIRNYTKKDFELWFEDYKLSAPNYKTELEAKENNDSFEASLRLQVRLVNLKTKEIKEQEVFLCDFPLMTERGTFIVNGVERVAISQLIRSPGAFFTSQLAQGQRVFGAKVIPNRGAWLEFETEASGFIVVRIDRKRKIAATTLLRALGQGRWDTESEIKELFHDVDTNPDLKYIEETLKRDPSHNQPEAFVEIYRRLRPGDFGTPDTSKDLIENMFFNFERYDLSNPRWADGRHYNDSRH